MDCLKHMLLGDASLLALDDSAKPRTEISAGKLDPLDSFYVAADSVVGNDVVICRTSILATCR